MKTVTINKAKELLLGLNGNILVLTHAHPDGDTIGSGVALTLALNKLGKNASLLMSDKFPRRFGYLWNKVKVFDKLPEGEYTIVAVDVPSPQQLSEEMRGLDIHLVLDHHLQNTVECEYKYVDATRAAAGEIIFQVIKLLGVEFDEDIATALYTAISSDSGGFVFSSTDGNTMRAAAELIDLGIDFADINRCIFDTITEAQFELQKLAFSILERHLDGKAAILPFTTEILEKAGIEQPEYGDVAQLPRRLEGVEVGMTIRPKDEWSYRVSFRSNKYLNVAQIAETFGGGGHYFAAACIIEGSIDEVKEKLLREVEKYI